MNDEVFGQLERKYNLFKYETMNLFAQEFKVKIVVEFYDNDSILNVQQQNYKNYLTYIKENNEKIINLIKKYFLDVYEKDVDIKAEITPTTVYFSRDGSWGILFDTKFDEENGFALFVENEKLSVGTQDMFI